MFIKKIIIDGFKSYGKRVEITGFDDSFNAITGFNGSGKSNILDAICFVLGLSKLELARCHLLSDLIYKNGQAGVTTASVTIEIDNSKGIFRQAEYRDSSTIIVRREINIKNQSKYYIGGFTVTKEKLLDFFQSVSLNIQNPHFLIMQGKIVKVVSMKPIEILSMVEEAVGVSVYENKKKQNLSKIDKCDNYLKEIDTIIEESIRPKLNQLKEEEKFLNEYRNVCNEFEQMNKISIAYRYLNDKAIVQTADTSIESNNSFIESKMEENVQLKNDSNKMAKEITLLQKRLDEEMGGDLKELESHVNEKRKHLERLNVNQKLKEDQLNDGQKELKSLQTKLDKENKDLLAKNAEYEVEAPKLEQLKEETESNEQSLEKARRDFEAVQMGLSKGLEGEEAATMAQQLMRSKDSLIEIEAKINKCKLVIQHQNKDLNEKKKKVKSDKDSYDRNTHEIQLMTKEMKTLEKELQEIDFNEERFEDVKQKINHLKKDSRTLEDKLQQLQSTVPGTKFKCPFPDIDRDKILGVVCELITVNSPEYELAIEKVCGGRLYSVVVEERDVAAQLLRKNLRERRTFLPLDHIKGPDTDLNALRIAERLVGKGNVKYAINMVSFDPKLKNAMKYVFGDTLVCPNMNMAKKVAFADGVMKRTVTYDGDVFDPSGTLTGGATKKGPSLLATVKEISMIEDELKKQHILLAQLEDEYQKLLQLSKTYYSHKSKYDTKCKAIELRSQMLQESSHYMLLKDIEDAEKLVKDEEENIKKYTEEWNGMLKQIKEIEYKIDNAESTREQERKEAKSCLEEAKKKFDKSTKLFEKARQKTNCLLQVIKHHEESVQNIQNQITKLLGDLESLKSQMETSNAEIEQAKQDLSVAEEKYNEYRSALNAKSNEITKLQKQLEKMNNSIHENELEIKKKQFEVEKIHTSIKEAKERIRSLIHKYSWIKEEEQFFQSPDSEYRVLQQNFNEDEFYSIMKTLKNKKDQLSKKVNLKANIMQGEKQKEFDELLKKRENTLKDRKRLLKYIEEIEEKKDKELCNAWEIINVNFGSIFSTLLPNSNAKLVPVKNNCIKDGLEIKVAFGEVWKQSLSELSGGQRSLVALSLVLALLKYNPAPLYILDEIDAALDQSHTQNIGIMIKKHFRNAQFIIVSLKDDMFSNANVLFQTKFIDGYSSVERIKNN